MKKVKTYKGLTIENIEEIKKIVLKGLEQNGNNFESILKLSKWIALDLHFYGDLKKVKQTYFSTGSGRFKELERFSRICTDKIGLSSVLECLSEL